jgi:hypothetical protein
MNLTMRDGGTRLVHQDPPPRDVDDLTAIIRRALDNGGALLVAYDVYSQAPGLDGEPQSAAVLTDAMCILAPDRVLSRSLLIEPPTVQDYSSAELVVIGIGRLVMGTPGGIEAMGMIGCEQIREQARSRQAQALQESRIVGVRQ